MTLLCTYHHKMLHEGGFSIVKEADDTLRFVTADGRTIPRCGYRLEDFVDDDIGGDADEEPSARDSAPQKCTDAERAEVREPAAVYRIRRTASVTRRRRRLVPAQARRVVTQRRGSVVRARSRRSR